MKYLANEMKKFRDLIHQATDLKLQLGPQFVNHSQAQVRKAYFEDMRRQVETILENRASRLSADEIMDVRNVFFTDLFPGVELNSSGYDRLFSELKHEGTDNWREWLHRSGVNGTTTWQR